MSCVTAAQSPVVLPPKTGCYEGDTGFIHDGSPLPPPRSSAARMALFLGGTPRERDGDEKKDTSMNDEAVGLVLTTQTMPHQRYDGTATQTLVR